MPSYKVKSGDTLGRIAKRFRVPMDSIVRLNRIRNPDRIRVGQELVIPENTTDGMDLVLPHVEESASPEPTGEEPKINRTRFRLPVKEYYPAVVDKDLVVLHFTAGRSARSAFDTWLQNSAHVATAYLVNPNGTIYELFDPAHWAYHLGVRGTSRQDKRSIGIEIANVGPLKLSPNRADRLNWWPGDWGTRFCGRDDSSQYVESTYRGINFFAAMPTEQTDAVAALVHHLCERFPIPKRIPPAARRMECDRGYFDGYRGVAAHQNFRIDKWDVGPAFEWERLGF